MQRATCCKIEITTEIYKKYKKILNVCFVKTIVQKNKIYNMKKKTNKTLIYVC